MILKSCVLTTIALGTVLMASSAVTLGVAKADQVACPPGAQCPPTGSGADQGKPHKSDMGKPGTPPPSGANQSGQNDNNDNPNNMDWKHRHRSGSGVDVGVSGSVGGSNEDWRRRHHRDNNGVDIGVGVYLGDGYDNGHYGHRRYYRGFVSCGEAGGIVRASGFRHVRTESCTPGRYRFSGARHGTLFTIAVSGGGRIVGVHPIN